MAERELTVLIDDQVEGERLDKALAAQLEALSRSEVQALIRDGRVTVDGRGAKPAYRVQRGEVIRVQLPARPQPAAPQPEAIALEVLYEDAHVAVIDKPAGMVVHPAFGHDSGTLVNAILARWPELAQMSETGRAGIVHRLDKDTSGVIVIAKTAEALRDLRAQFKQRAVHKRYIALVEGRPDTSEGVIDAPIGRDPQQRKRMAVVRDGRAAITHYRVAETFAEHTLLDVLPETGRTHQIRVHLAFIGHPVVGDAVYGYRKQRLKLGRYFLHAAEIAFELPGTGQAVTVCAPLPGALAKVLDDLRR